MKRVIIVGSAGQDGRILFDQLQRDGAEVLGIARNGIRSTKPHGQKTLDIHTRAEVAEAVRLWNPSEIYYLAAFHHSSQDETGDDAVLFERSFAVHVFGLINFCEAMKQHAPNTRLFYAASSLVFGDPVESPQTEATSFSPRCPYGISKAAGMQCCRYYRRAHNLFAASGILYNHESHYRRENFVSQKIIRGARAIAAGRQDKLVLGDLSARIDWGFAPDFVRAMRALLALPEPDDFIIATGETHSVQEFVEIVFEKLDLDWRQYVEENPALLTRKAALRVGNPARLQARTGWQPSVTFEEMIARLIQDAPQYGY
jgi:GDPmannose 4,6-dehydratase